MLKKAAMLLFLLSAGISGQIAPYYATLFNGSGAAVYDRLLALTLAGIVNRDSARLYLVDVYETWSFNQTDEMWRDIYRQRGNVVFDSAGSISELINKFRPFLNGAITYDLYRYYGNFSGQSFNYQGEMAAVLGGLSNRLPVSASQAATYGLAVTDSVVIVDVFDGDPSASVPARLEQQQHPWNNASLTEEERYLTLVEYLSGTVLPLCNPRRLYIREITDFTVQQRMFQVNFAGTNDLDLNSMSIRKADILENILHHLKSKNPTAIFHIFGWIRPEPMTQWFAQFGSSFHETLLGNLSWHSSFRVAPKRLQLKSNVLPDTVVVRNNYYLVFIGTEGDAGNWNFGFQSGAWLSAQRGNIPLAWGWNLQLLALCPFVVQYYFDTATPKDGFISVTSPLGYAYPDLWGNDVWNNAVDSSRRLTDEFSIREFYAYKHYAAAGTMVYRGKTINNSFNFTKLGAFQKAISANMTFLFDPMLQTQTPNTAYGSLLFNHVNDGTFYGDASNLNSMAANILGLIRNKPKPYFLLAGYQRLRQDNFSGRSAPSSGDINIPRLQQLIALLAADTSTGRAIEVVTPQYFSALLRKKLGLPNTAEEETDRLPAELRLWQNYPNPFNPATVIRYHVPGNGQQSTACVSPQKALTDNPSTANGTRVRFVSLNIYDALGSIVARLVNELQPEGTHEVLFNGAGLPSGIYFYALHIDGYTQTRKMALLK